MWVWMLTKGKQKCSSGGIVGVPRVGHAFRCHLAGSVEQGMASLGSGTAVVERSSLYRAVYGLRQPWPCLSSGFHILGHVARVRGAGGVPIPLAPWVSSGGLFSHDVAFHV